MTSEKTFQIIRFHFIFSQHKITPRDIGSMSKIYVMRQMTNSSHALCCRFDNMLGWNIKLRLSSDIFSPYRFVCVLAAAAATTKRQKENSKVMTNNQFIIINILIPQFPAIFFLFLFSSLLSSLSTQETFFIYLSYCFIDC